MPKRDAAIIGHIILMQCKKSRAQVLGTEDPQLSESEVLVRKPVQPQTDTPEAWSEYLSSKELSSTFSSLFPTGIFTPDL